MFFSFNFLLSVWNKTCQTCFLWFFFMQMASMKRKAAASRPREPYDTTRFVSEVAWEWYAQNVLSWKIFLEKNVTLYISEYDEFRRELERRQWHRALTRQPDNHIDVALVKEFYANLYDLEEKSQRHVRVWSKLIKFDVASLNVFLKTPPVIQLGE